MDNKLTVIETFLHKVGDGVEEASDLVKVKETIYSSIHHGAFGVTLKSSNSIIVCLQYYPDRDIFKIKIYKFVDEKIVRLNPYFFDLNEATSLKEAVNRVLWCYRDFVSSNFL